MARKTYRHAPNRPGNVGTDDRDAGRFTAKRTAGRVKAGRPDLDEALRQGIAMGADGHQLTTLRRPRKMGRDGIAGS